MRIAVDARLLEARDGGSSVYTRALLDAFAECPDRNEYVLICRPGLRARMKFERRFLWMETPEARLMDEEWEQMVLPGVIGQLSPDVYFAPTSVLPAVKICPQVTIIHDVAIEEEPGFYPTSLRGYLSKWLRAAAAQADHILTVSRHAKSGIRRVYGVSEERVSAIHLAAEELFQPIPDDQERRRLLQEYGIRGPYVLSVAALELNKNLNAILKAYHLAGGRSSVGQPLILVGGFGGAEARLRRAISQFGLGDEVTFTGYVPRDHLPALYSGASCFLWGSLYEGFGLPPLEAMACGTPVIASNRTSIPEVLGDAAILVDPTQPQAIAEALSQVTRDTQLGQALRQAGLQRAAMFSWHRTGRETLDCLAHAAKGGQRNV